MLSQLYVLGTDGNLWLESAQNGNWGQVPPPRQQVDGNVAAFQAFPELTGTSPGYFALVLGTDGNLWYEYTQNGSWGQIPPPRQQVDGNVATFQAAPDPQAAIFILGTDGNLWLDEGGSFGHVPPPSRQHVDASVAAFDAVNAVVNGFNTLNALVLGKDGDLWLESAAPDGKWGQVPPPRQQVDGNVAGFSVVTAGTELLVAGNDGDLWLESAQNGKWGQVPPPRQQVDGNVLSWATL
jgi:hypothetical protein